MFEWSVDLLVINLGITDHVGVRLQMLEHRAHFLATRVHQGALLVHDCPASCTLFRHETKTNWLSTCHTNGTVHQFGNPLRTVESVNIRRTGWKRITRLIIDGCIGEVGRTTQSC